MKNKVIHESRLSIVVLFCVSLVAVFLFSSPLSAATAVEGAAKKIIRKINSEFKLKGQVVHVEPDQFYEKNTGERPLFSRQIYDALVLSLTDYGGVATLQDVGDEPLQLAGYYVRDESKVTISVKLRQFNGSANLDVASGSAAIPLKKIEASVLQGGIEGLVDGLIHQIEQDYLDLKSSVFTVEHSLPAVNNQPNLRFGAALSTAIETALLQSDVFGAVDVVKVSERKLSWRGTYQVIGENMFVDLSLVTESGKVMNKASGKLPISSIPPELLEMVKEGGPKVCVGYKAEGKRAVADDSVFAEDMVEQLITALNEADINPDNCSGDDEGIQVYTSLVLQKKKTSFPYDMLLGSAKINVYHKGKTVWKKPGKAHLPATGDVAEVKGRVIANILSPELITELKEKILTASEE